MVHCARLRTCHAEDDDDRDWTVTVGIIAALPREVGALVKGWERREVARSIWVWTRGNAVVACAGMGAARAQVAVEAALAAMPVRHLISVGLAGACDAKLRVGDVVRAGVVIDAVTGERFEDATFQQVLVTADAIVNVHEKLRLRAAFGADAVDMEAAAVGRIARERGLGFRAIKAVSDEADFELEGLARFATADGQFREGAFAFHAAMRPATWGRVIALGRNSGIAVRALTEELRVTLDWYEKIG
jgi:adenosylhomocysteine nucleosidase